MSCVFSLYVQRSTPPRSLALVSLLTFCGLRISEALNAEVRDYGHDHGHRVLKVTRKGGKTARVALAPPVVRALDDYLAGRTTGRIFVGRDGESRYSYKTANEQIARLCHQAGLPAGVIPHSLRHSYATESLRLVLRCRTSRTRSVTPTPAPPVGTTAAGTTSTAHPTTCWLPP